jgi:hypothetical protein
MNSTGAHLYCAGCNFNRTAKGAKEPFSFFRGSLAPSPRKWKLRTLRAVLDQLEHAWSLPTKKEREAFMRKHGLRVQNVKGVRVRVRAHTHARTHARTRIYARTPAHSRISRIVLHLASRHVSRLVLHLASHLASRLVSRFDLYHAAQKWFALHPDFFPGADFTQIAVEDGMHLEADGLLQCACVPPLAL